MDKELCDARGLGARCNRRDVLRWSVGTGFAVGGVRFRSNPAGASPEPDSTEPIDERLSATMTDVSYDTRRIAGLGFAMAALVVASRLIRDKERDPEL